MVIGTHLGVISLWDIRFQMHVKAWRLSEGGPISAISSVPDSKRDIYIFHGQKKVSLWDIKTDACKEVWSISLKPGAGEAVQQTQVSCIQS
jgi:phosphoinositide-3-kinase regulatory subunit 4